MIEVLEIQINFSQGLITTWEQMQKILCFLREKRAIPAYKKSEILFKCAETLLNEYKEVDKMPNSARNKVIELLDESTKLSINEKQLQMLGNLHLSILDNSSIAGDSKTSHLKLALSSFMKLLCTRQTDNEYYLQGCLKVLSILFQFSRNHEIVQ